MGKLVTLATLRSDVRYRYDIDSSNSRLTDAQLDRLINLSLSKLAAIVIDTDETYLEATATITTSAGIDVVSLPTRFAALIDVKIDIDGCREPLRRATQEEMGGPLQSYQWSERLPVYRLGQGVLYLWPAPQGAYPVRITYLESFADLVLGTDTWDAHPSWVEWVTLDVLSQVRLRDRSYADVQALRAMLQEQEARVRASITSQDRSGPQYSSRVADSGPYRELAERVGRWDE